MRTGMTKIILIDDDYSTELLVESLTFRGYDARRIKSAATALQSMDEVISADLIILDIIMERPPSAAEPTISGDTTTGMALLRVIRERNPNVPVLVFSGTGDQMLVDAVKRTPKTAFLSKWGAPSRGDFLDKVEHLIGGGKRLLELGYFLGIFGRLSGRVFLLHKGPLDLPSDLSGVIYIDIKNGVEAAGEKIRKELDRVR
jgi:CheY-like chemotaxis protein